MIRYATTEDAKKAVAGWQGHPSSVQHIGDRGNSVFSFMNAGGNPQILRFTDPGFRTFAELLAELHFVNHLHRSGVAVAHALPAISGELAFETLTSSGPLICSSVAFAQGEEVLEGSKFWNQEFFAEWGRNLAMIHNAATTFDSGDHGPKRWHWQNEILFTRAEELIPQEDEESREELREVLDSCQQIEVTAMNFGLIHADHAPQNFRYNPASKRLTAFDFGNCCYHWFISDLAISLSTIRRKKNREEIRAAIFRGYTSERALPADVEKLVDIFIRLRVVYVYLSRLHLWSQNRTAEQQRDLEIFRDLVHAKQGWSLRPS